MPSVVPSIGSRQSVASTDPETSSSGMNATVRMPGSA